ncbi:MAG: hypothetical protein AAFN41_13605, partial [Planctomycetota bacterium]
MREAACHRWQLFASISKRRGVGDTVREEVSEAAADRVDELDGLDVLDGLNTKSEEAAQALLDAESAQDEAALVDLLKPKTRRAVERIAHPSAPTVDDPLRHLVEVLYEHLATGEDEEEPVEGVLVLTPRPPRGAHDLSDYTLALFAFLFGPTLADVAGASERQGGVTFQVDARLTNAGELASLLEEAAKSKDVASDDPEGGPSLDDVWKDVELRLQWEDEQGALAQFRWSPKKLNGHVVTALVTVQALGCTWKTEEVGFEEWCERALEMFRLDGALDVDSEEGTPSSQWQRLRLQTFGSLATEGLAYRTLDHYFQTWVPLLEQVTNDYVPKGKSLAEVRRFLSIDIHRGTGDAPTMLATHPLRLRWLAAHLRTAQNALDEVLRGQLRLNQENPTYYFECLSARSPHAQPPIISDDSRIYVAVREQCWHERYQLARDKSRTHTDWLSDIDDASLDEVGRAIGTYADAHPHKVDGMTLLLVVRRGGASMLQRIVKQLLGQRGALGSRSEARLTLHIVAPPQEFGRIAHALEEFDRPLQRAKSDFPSIR